MNKNTAKFYMIGGGAALILLVVSLLMFFFGIYRPFIWGVIGIPAIYLGYKGYTSPEADDSLKRNDLMFRAFFPGYVQIKYMKRKTGMLKMIAFLICAVCVMIGTVLLFSTDQAMIDIGTILFIYGMIMPLFLMFWSCVEVNEYCNEANMPHEGKAFEMFLKKNRQVMMLTQVVMVLTFLGLLAWFHSEGLF